MHLKSMQWFDMVNSWRSHRGVMKLALLLGITAGSCSGTAWAQTVSLVGLNLSGAGFASQVLPGINGTNYIFPSEAYFSQWSARGVKLIRFPIIWERLQPTLGGALDPTYAALIDRTFGYADKYGMKIILDLHNYMRYRGVVIGTGNVAYAQYQDVLTRIAQRWSSHTSLYAYDIMNEPHDAVAQWSVAAQYGINGVRSVDSTRPIMIEGNGWAEATRWPQWNDALLALKDPANNLIFQAHTYFDGEGGGGNYAVTSASAYPDDYGVQRVKPFVDWLKKNGKRGMIGEFGVPDSDPRWNVIMGRMLAYLKQNCIPATYWAAGPGWANYNLSVEPINGVDRPQWATLKAYLDDSSCTQIGPLSSTNETATAVDSSSYTSTVASVYRDYLGREADQAGLTFWSTQMASGSMTLAGVINAIVASAEYQNRVAVERLYQSYLGRSADSAGLSYWAGQLNSGAMTVNSIAAALIGSTEYQGNLQNTVNQLYVSYLGRNADPSGLSTWAKQISDGVMTIAAVKAAIAGSSEGQAYAQSMIQQLYRNYLSREADAGGLTNWMSQVTSGAMTLDDVATAIKGSAEYRSRQS
nr:cellulase family glycosylhydrolase [Pseudomonas psychrotolerans]